jgi:hypothetical protein
MEPVTVIEHFVYLEVVEQNATTTSKERFHVDIGIGGIRN